MNQLHSMLIMTALERSLLNAFNVKNMNHPLNSLDFNIIVE